MADQSVKALAAIVGSKLDRQIDRIRNEGE